jgi:acetylserotonin N-methyltransferase
MTIEAPLCDDRLIWDAWLSVYYAPALSAADELGLFDELNARPASAGDLAEQMGWNLEALQTVLPLLAGQGLLTVRQGRYHLSDVARTYLLHNTPLYWGHAFSVLRGSPNHVRFVAAVKATPVGPMGAFGEGGRPVESWEAGQMADEMARGLTAFMHSHSVPAAIGVAAKGDFEGVTRLLDVGGGSGCFSIALADRLPHMRCTVMELPAVCALAREYVSGAGLEDRIDTVTVDMFREPWPRGYDAVFMSNIVHDWGVDANAGLLASAFKALPAGGRIYLHEMLMADDGSGPLTTAAFSGMMLVGTKGRQYSYVELARLLEDAGFADVSATETYGYFTLVTARKR